MEALRIHIERIVRPIRAGGRRKNKMREELLAHLERRCEDDMARGTTQQQAQDFAMTQLGDPEALRNDLQATVPFLERMLFVKLPFATLDSWFDRSHDESAIHFVLVRTICMTMFAVLLIALLFVIDHGPALVSGFAGEHEWHDLPTQCSSLLLMPCLIGLGAFIAHVLVEVTGLRRNLSKMHSAGLFLRVISLNAFIGVQLLIIVFGGLFVEYLTAPPRVAAVTLYALGSVARILIPAVVFSFVVGMPFTAWVMVKEHERYEKWGRLKIDE
ncbi:MAG: hypothetical protein HUU46_20140 [Candidatus Hydrogenedentes bacterium]|nr:hypothetical protein [Candidatus Hydrogenedentota bacterium]